MRCQLEIEATNRFKETRDSPAAPLPKRCNNQPRRGGRDGPSYQRVLLHALGGDRKVQRQELAAAEGAAAVAVGPLEVWLQVGGTTCSGGKDNTSG